MRTSAVEKTLVTVKRTATGADFGNVMRHREHAWFLVTLLIKVNGTPLGTHYSGAVSPVQFPHEQTKLVLCHVAVVPLKFGGPLKKFGLVPSSFLHQRAPLSRLPHLFERPWEPTGKSNAVKVNNVLGHEGVHDRGPRVLPFVVRVAKIVGTTAVHPITSLDG